MPDVRPQTLDANTLNPRMTSAELEARIYVKKVLQPYIDKVRQKEEIKVSKPEVGTVLTIELAVAGDKVFKAININASVIYTRIGYLELNNSNKKVYHRTLKEWCKSIGVEEDAVRIGL